MLNDWIRGKIPFFVEPPPYDEGEKIPETKDVPMKEPS